MYLHIGKNEIIISENIIGIFDIQSLEKHKTLKLICEELKIEDTIVDVSEENQKTLILVKEKDKIKGYISNISSNTLARREQTNIIQ